MASLRNLSNESDPVRSAKMSEIGPNHLKVTAVAEKPALLVISFAYFPFWSATVNGSPAAVLRVNGGMMGVVVPPGNAEVLFTYRPYDMYLGLFLTLASIGVPALGAALARRRGVAT